MIKELFNEPNLIVMIGKSKSGKSYLARSLLTQACLKKYFSFGLIFCQTKFNGGYDYVPDKYVIAGYDEEILGKYLKKIEDYQNKTGKKPPRSFIIFDDIMGSLKNSDLFKKFVSTYRHYNISVIICMQYVAGLSTLGREQISFAFIFPQSTARSFKMLYESIGGDFESDKQFTKFIKEGTKEKYSCIFYDESANDLEDKFRKFKAKKVEDIKIKY